VTTRTWTWGKVALFVLPAGLLCLLVLSINDLALTQRLFVDTTYYFLMATVLCWGGTYLHAAGGLSWGAALGWAKENWPGLIVAGVVTVVTALAVEPALLVLSDEANLVGTSKNLFASKTATFTVSGKNYYGNYWDIDVGIDRRPTLFPFMVSLVHTVFGYSYRNVFLFNLLVLPVFVLVCYRLAKSLGGETFAVVAALFVVAHPITLISVRSGGFDFFAVFFALLVLKSLLDFCRDQAPAKLALLWLNLCMFSEIRYESALFVPPVVALLLLFRMVTWASLRPYAFVYALTPAYLLPRIWQSMLRGNIPEQEPGAITFSAQNFLNNAHEYLEPLLSPSRSYPAHSASLIALGVVGCALWLRWLLSRVRAREWTAPHPRFASFVAAWMLVQVIVVFTYVWGRAQYPSAARLVIALDTFFSFAAAWLVTVALQRWRPFVAVLLAAAVFAIQLPVASQHWMNKLTQTRESAATWSFFERLQDKRILIVTDRPNHFTIMDYGAMSFESARRDPHLLTAFKRHLFQDVYLIQQIRLSTNEPLPGYEIGPIGEFDAVYEFQNDADVLVRVSRLVR
jgi:Dolichyl-phosphate-mannose-protein mannosyltransferase